MPLCWPIWQYFRQRDAESICRIKKGHASVTRIPYRPGISIELNLSRFGDCQPFYLFGGQKRSEFFWGRGLNVDRELGERRPHGGGPEAFIDGRIEPGDDGGRHPGRRHDAGER